MNTTLKIVKAAHTFKEVSLIAPSPNYYLHIAAETDAMFLPFPLWQSRKKQLVLREAKKWCNMLEKENEVVSAVVFTAVVIPPGGGRLPNKDKRMRAAKFDVSILIETKSREAINNIISSGHYREMYRLIEEKSKSVYKVVAVNAKRINPVDHSKKGVFLFNYFYGEDLGQTLAVWEFTAGWFQQETGLDNSTVLLPVNREESLYTIINHCRWDRLRDVLPSLLFKKSFRSYVLANFYANNVTPMPVIYKMA